MPKGKFREADEAEWARREAVIKRVASGEISGAAAGKELGVSRQAVLLWKVRFRETGVLAPRGRGRPKVTPLDPSELQKVRDAVAAWRRAQGIKSGERIPRSKRPSITEMTGIVSKALGRKVSGSFASKTARRIGVLVAPDPLPELPPDDPYGPPPGAGAAPEPLGRDDIDDDIELPLTADEYEAWIAETRAMLGKRAKMPDYAALEKRATHGQRTGKHAKAKSPPKKKKRKNR
jgi:hypothetical protein